MTTIEDANFALQKVLDAGSQKNVIELAWIKNVRVTIPRVIVTLSLPSFANSQRDRIVLLDADIYGPNTPSMMGVAEQNPKVTEGSGSDQRLIPINKYGISLVSMGFLIEEGQPVIWRGPMLNSIIRQFLYQVEWNNLDFLVIDLPPGTGDAQISLSQSVPISGAIVVTTPQQVSLQDARRGLAMFKQLGVPLLGIVENMSVFIPPDMPGKKYEIFGKGGGQTLANENDLPLLAQIPIEIPLVDDSNKGVPISISQPNKESSVVFGNLAQLIKNQFVDS